MGGVFRHVSDLVRAQAAAGHAVGLVCDAGDTAGGHEKAALAALAPHLELGLHRIPMSRSIGPGDLATAARLWSTLRPLRPQVIHGHGAKGGTFSRLIGTALRLTGRPVVSLYSPHGGSLHYDPKRWNGRLYFGFERGLERAGDALVFVSRFEESTYHAKVGRPACPSALIYNGLADSEYRPVLPDADAADIVCVGEMRHLKGTDVLIDAIAILRSQGRRVTAALIGPGTERPAYEAQVRRAGLSDSVTFSESLPIRTALARGRLAVVPSRAESLPYVVLETIASGRPLVATGVGGIPEIFGAAADRLVPAGDPHSLAAALSAAMDDPAGSQARASALAEAIRPVFSIHTMAGAVEHLYRRLLADAPARRPAVSPNPIAHPEHRA